MTKKKSKKSQIGNVVIRAKRLPRIGEQFAIVREGHGGSRFTVLCTDGKTRLMRIGGKFKRRMWVRPNDIVLIKPWVVQGDSKCDLVYRYLPAERKWLYRKNKIPEDLVI